MNSIQRAVNHFVDTAIVMVDIFVAKLWLKDSKTVVYATGVSQEDDESTCCGGGCGCSGNCDEE